MESPRHKPEFAELVGKRVRLKRTLTLQGSDTIHEIGEIWTVEEVNAGTKLTTLFLRKPTGTPHIWMGDTFEDWFEAVPKILPSVSSQPTSG